MYFGNSSWVLEYDGINWKNILVANNTAVRSLAIDSSGIIYVDAQGEFGYLTPDPKGNLIYISLLNKVPENERDFNEVWNTYTTTSDVYFLTINSIFQLTENDTIIVIKPDNVLESHFGFVINNELYIIQKNIGITKLVKGKLKLIPQGDFFANERVYTMLPYNNEYYGNNKVLIGTHSKGLFIYDRNSEIFNSKNKNTQPLISIQTEIDQYLFENHLYHGTMLPNGNFAFATRRGGVVIINDKGNLVDLINKDVGLQDEYVLYVNSDMEQGLWMGLGNGISRAEIDSPLRIWGDELGLKGSVQAITRFNGVLFVATSQGVYYMSTNKFKSGSFKKLGHAQFFHVEGIATQSWDFILFKNKLLVTTNDGVYEIYVCNNNFCNDLIKEGFSRKLYRSRTVTSRIYIGLKNGIASIKYKNKEWIDEGKIESIEEEIRSIAEDKNGNIWLGTDYHGIIYLKINDQDNSIVPGSKRPEFIQVKYDTTNGLPGMKNNYIHHFKDRLIFATDSGLFRFDENKTRFFPDSALGKRFFNVGKGIYRFIEDDFGNVWMYAPDKSGKEKGLAILQENGTYQWFTTPFRRIFDLSIRAIYPEKNGITWLGSTDGLIKYDGNIKKVLIKKFLHLSGKLS